MKPYQQKTNVCPPILPRPPLPYLLPHGAELWMPFTDQGLEHAWTDALWLLMRNKPWSQLHL